MGIIPVSDTLFTPLNIVVAICLLIFLPLMAKLLSPRDPKDMVTVDMVLPNVDKLLEEEEEGFQEAEMNTFASKLEHSWIISMIVGIMGLIIIIWYFATKGFALNLNIVNFTFLFVGIISTTNRSITCGP